MPADQNNLPNPNSPNKPPMTGEDVKKALIVGLIVVFATAGIFAMLLYNKMMN